MYNSEIIKIFTATETHIFFHLQKSQKSINRNNDKAVRKTRKKNNKILLKLSIFLNKKSKTSSKRRTQISSRVKQAKLYQHQVNVSFSALSGEI